MKRGNEMIHKIEPHKYNPEFSIQPSKKTDYLLIFEDDRVFLLNHMIPTFEQIYETLTCKYSLEYFLLNAEYLFSIDEMAFYRMNIDESGIAFTNSEDFHSQNVFRTMQPEYMAFAGITAFQINRFRVERKFCGKCGNLMAPSRKERAMICSSCGKVEYPKISPAVITGIINNDKILLTKYAGGGYRNWALVAGFVEVGETFKGTVRREVMEEVGLTVGNIQYYKSQPWSFSDTAMIGFFAELAGKDDIVLQEEELAEAKWFTREEIPEMPSDISIGQEMIMLFKNNGNPFKNSHFL